MTVTAQSIIGFRRNGEPIFSLIGAEDAPNGIADPDSGSKVDGEVGQSTDDKPKQESEGQSTQGKEVTREDFERLQKQLSAADKRRQEVEDENKSLKDRDKTELEKVTGRVSELEQSVKQLEQRNKTLKLHNAFLCDNTYSWQDPSDILRFLADDDSVSIDDEGNVTGMNAFLKRLANAKPWLIRNEQKKAPETPSGDPLNSGLGSKTTSQESLRKKYPSLAGR